MKQRQILRRTRADLNNRTSVCQLMAHSLARCCNLANFSQTTSLSLGRGLEPRRHCLCLHLVDRRFVFAALLESEFANQTLGGSDKMLSSIYNYRGILLFVFPRSRSLSLYHYPSQRKLTTTTTNSMVGLSDCAECAALCQLSRADAALTITIARVE